MLKKSLFATIFITSLFSNQLNIIENYLAGKEYEKYLDNFTLKDSFINYLMQNKNLKYGFYQYPAILILSFKNKKKLSLINTKNLNRIGEFNILTGKNSGDKWREGDGKTPIGSYELTTYLSENQLSEQYGFFAYPTNYPNLYDKYLKKDGHGIWIHGTPLKENSKKIDTKGCIAMQNSDLLKFHNIIDYKKAILIIVNKRVPTTNRNEIKDILKNIFEWRYAWKYNNLKKYLSFYNKKEFKKDNRYGFRYFKTIKTTIFNRNQKKIVKFSNIKIIPYPNSQNKKVFKVEFDELYKSINSYFSGKKILYLTLKNGKISIFLEN